MILDISDSTEEVKDLKLSLPVVQNVASQSLMLLNADVNNCSTVPAVLSAFSVTFWVHAGLRFPVPLSNFKLLPVTAILIQLSVQALRQRLLGLSVVIRVICPFLLTIPPQLLQLLLVFLAKTQLYLISLPLLITHTHRGDIQVMLLTLSTLFFSQLTGQLNCFFFSSLSAVCF